MIKALSRLLGGIGTAKTTPPTPEAVQAAPVAPLPRPNSFTVARMPDHSVVVPWLKHQRDPMHLLTEVLRCNLRELQTTTSAPRVIPTGHDLVLCFTTPQQATVTVEAAAAGGYSFQEVWGGTLPASAETCIKVIPEPAEAESFYRIVVRGDRAMDQFSVLGQCQPKAPATAATEVTAS